MGVTRGLWASPRLPWGRCCQGVTLESGGRYGEQAALESLWGQRGKGRCRKNTPGFRLGTLRRSVWQGAEGRGHSLPITAERHPTIFAARKPQMFPGSVQVKSFEQL